MSDMYGPPQEYNGRGDALVPNYGVTPQGDLVRYPYEDAQGLRVGPELGYDGQGNPIYFDTTVQGDLIPRGLDIQYFSDKPHYWSEASEDWLEYDPADFSNYFDTTHLGHHIPRGLKYGYVAGHLFVYKSGDSAWDWVDLGLQSQAMDTDDDEAEVWDVDDDPYEDEPRLEPQMSEDLVRRVKDALKNKANGNAKSE